MNTIELSKLLDDALKSHGVVCDATQRDYLLLMMERVLLAGYRAGSEEVLAILAGACGRRTAVANA